MPQTTSIAVRRKKPGLRRLIQERAWVRHPVSVTRDRLSIGILVLLSVGFALYVYNTRDEAIRLRVLQFLSDATSGDVQVGAAHFRMFGGITLYNVQVSVPYDDKLDPLAKDARERRIFSASSLTLIHNPWRLLLGTLRVEQIIAARPEIRLVQNVDSGVRNWQLLTGPRNVAAARKGPLPRPRINIRSAKAVSISVYSNGQREERAEELDADIRPSLTSDTSFAIEVRRFSDPAERTTVVFDPMVKMVSNTPYVDARTVRLQLPKVAQQIFDQIALQGEAKIGRFMYDKQNPATMDIEVELRRVRCPVPLSTLRSGESSAPRDASASPDPDATVVTLTDAVGHLAVRQGKMDVDVSGLFNGAKCLVKGTLSGVEHPLAQMGIDVKIQGSRVPAPVGPARDRIITDPAVPSAIKSFFVDYDPRGNFDIDVRLTRPDGPDGRVALFGTLRPLGATGNCRHFPYEVSDLEGEIRVEGDRIYLNEVTGNHQQSRIKVSATIDRQFAWAQASVQIEATRVGLDDDLFAALSDDSRRLWTRFNPSGFADLSIRLDRTGSNTGSAPAPWRSRITAELNDSKLRFNEYPYPMDEVRGRLSIEGTHLEFAGLTGRRKSAEVRIDGEADLPEGGPAQVSLRIDAKSVPLDEALAQSLPPEGRGAFEQFAPEGRIDLAGDISLKAPEAGVRFDLKATINDAAISYQQFPYRITQVCGAVILRPEGFSILDVTGRHGDAVVKARGDIHRTPASQPVRAELATAEPLGVSPPRSALAERGAGGYIADLSFDCQNLRLAPDLYIALPPSLKEVWDRLKPEGTIHVQTALHHESRGGQSVQRHRSRLSVHGGAMCFAGFPLKLSNVDADMLVTDRSVEIRSLAGQGAGGRVALSGEIDLESGGREGTLVLDAQGMSIRADLLSALPAELSEQLRTSKAVGGFDLHLDPLTFREPCDAIQRQGLMQGTGKGEPGTAPEAGPTLWRFEGRMKLNDLSADLGIEFRGLRGELKGSGSVGPDGGLSLDALADLSRASLAGWELQDLTGQIRQEPGRSRLEFRDMAAKAYGGLATGSAAVEQLSSGAGEQGTGIKGTVPHSLIPSSPRSAPLDYHVSILARDMQLAEWLGEQGMGNREQGTGNRNVETSKSQNVKKRQPLTPNRVTGSKQSGPLPPQSGYPRGTIDGNIIFQGRTGPSGYREGSGELFVRHAEVWRMPILFLIFQVLNLTPDENVFHDGWLKFDLAENVLTFRKIDLQGKAMSFIGNGTMSLPDKALNLTLLARSPVRIRIPLLTDALELFSREIMEVRVGGTVDSPTINPQPLKTLGIVVRALSPKPKQPKALSHKP